jgi:Ca-activated chloride channel homolog
LPVAVTAVFAVLVTGAFSIGPSVDRARCTQLSIASSQEKAVLLTGFANEFNATKPQVEGRCILVTVFKKNSGDAEAALETGWKNEADPRPDVWSPASEAWADLLADRAPVGASPLPDASQWRTLFTSPIVVGVLKPIADQLEYQAKVPSWNEILTRANNPDFKLAVTNPTVSTSGLNALIASFTASQGEIRGAETLQQEQSGQAQHFVQAIESSVVHYDLTVNTVLSNLDRFDRNGNPTAYASAIVLEEQELVAYDQTASTLLVPIYPIDGTLVENHPYILLTWSNEKKAAADAFYHYVVDVPDTQRAIDAAGFRDHNDAVVPNGQLGARLTLDGGDPNLAPNNLPLPSGKVLDQMLNDWKKLRKPADVLVVVQGTPKRHGVEQAALCKALGDFSQADDRLTLTLFPSGSGTSLQPTAINTSASSCTGPNGALGTALASKPPASNQQLDDVVLAAVQSLQTAGSPKSFKAVLLVDLDGGAGLPTDDTLKRELRTELLPGADLPSVRVFCVGPASKRLQAISLAGEGVLYAPTGVSRFFDDLLSDP